jgi:hypothetical protein
MSTCHKCGFDRQSLTAEERCPRCGVLQLPGAAADPTANRRAQQAKTMVKASQLMGWGGLALIIVGAVAGGMVKSTTLAGALAGLGIISAVAGAIIGQIGRGMQGRVI